MAAVQWATEAAAGGPWVTLVPAGTLHDINATVMQAFPGWLPRHGTGFASSSSNSDGGGGGGDGGGGGGD